MVLVTGAVIAKPEHFDEVLKQSLEHVARSRLEPGCLSHAVHRDVEDPMRLVFVEEWADLEALHRHFAVPASVEFGRTLMRLSSARPSLHLYDARRIDP